MNLSIILPIYNVELFLKKCIQSLEDQDIPKDTYEIICVNDGSPDNCKQIILDFQKKFSNIVLIDQDNQGVSVARNNGIKASKGKYIMFVDPDDAIESNILNNLLYFIKKHELEVVYSPLTFVEMNEDSKQTFFDDERMKVVDGCNLYFYVRGRNIIDPDRNYGALYTRKLLKENHLFYLKDVPYLEDGEFIARVLCLAKRTAIYNVPYYLRLNRPGSATKSALFNQNKTIKGFIKAAKNLENFKLENNLSIEQIGLINGRIVKFVVLAIQASLKNYKKFKWARKELTKEGFKQLNLQGVKGGFEYFGLQYNRSMVYLLLILILKNLKKSIYLKIRD